jgi:hypothetical protein
MPTVPNVPENLERVGPGTDNTPLFRADISTSDLEDSIRARFEILTRTEPLNLVTENEDKLVTETGLEIVGRTFQYFQEVDSPFVEGSGTVEAEYSNALPVGVYGVRAKAISAQNPESGYTSIITFIVSQIVSSEFKTLLWNIKEFVESDNKTLIWNVTVAGERIGVLRWNQREPQLKDNTLRWIKRTPWREVDYNEDIWRRIY